MSKDWIPVWSHIQETWPLMTFGVITTLRSRFTKEYRSFCEIRPVPGVRGRGSWHVREDKLILLDTFIRDPAVLADAEGFNKGVRIGASVAKKRRSFLDLKIGGETVSFAGPEDIEELFSNMLAVNEAQQEAISSAEATASAQRGENYKLRLELREAERQNRSLAGDLAALLAQMKAAKFKPRFRLNGKSRPSIIHPSLEARAA